NGVDPEGLLRAALANWREGEVVQGGSTITQQYVKNTYTTGERDIARKLREALIATRLERELTKDEILFRYLNTTYFGDGAYGIGAAAESYFGKPVSELTLSEAALLAGAIASPANYGPRVNAEVAEGRRMTVLRAMRDQELITQRQFRRARRQHIWFAPLGPALGPATVVQAPPSGGATAHPYFVDYVRRELERTYGHRQLYRGGLRIETTIDPRLQAMAEASVAETLDGTAPPLEMSLVSVEPSTGHVRAFIGGRDFDASQVNLGLGGSAGMQPGSSFKTFVLATALEHGIDPETMFEAPASLEFPGCDPTCTINNSDFEDHGAMTLRAATAASTNTVYAALADQLGPHAVAEMAQRLGVSAIDPRRPYGVSLALGAYEVSPLDMAAGYATIANRGVRQRVTPILRVLDRRGNVLEDHTAPEGEAVLDPIVADTVSDVLQGVIQGGTGEAADIGRPAAGKTGTAQDYRAAWFAGYTPQLSTAVWMGYSDVPRPLEGIKGLGSVTGGSFPAQTWQRFMAQAHEGVPVIGFVPPGPLPDLVPTAGEPAPEAPVPPAPAPPAPEPFSASAGEELPPGVVPNDCGGPCTRDLVP
ncbi:MAG TPA: transglycosylase domain-containing protein, partial [Acidimicrobiales bacterium]|nr:transglycosylase domain-containing protein [Acidimicrobiales bacterium]